MTKIAEPLVPSYRGPVDAGAIVADLATRDALNPLYGQRCVVLSNQTEYQWDGSTWVIPSTGGGGDPTLQDVTSQGNTTTDDLIIGGLDIVDTSQAPVLRLSRNQNIGSTSWIGESLGDIEWYTNDPSNPNVFARIRTVGGPQSGTPNAGYPDGHLVFETSGQQGGSLSEKMRISDEGLVSIGVSLAYEKLHVGGNIRAEDNVYARGKLVVGPVTVGTKAATVGGNMNFDTIAEPTSGAMGLMTATTQNVAGNIEPGTYYYAIMYVDADGAETGQCATPYPSAVITDSATAGQILLQNIPISPDERVTKRKIYRTQGYGSFYASKYLATINDNDATTSWTDNYSNSSLDQATNNYRKRNTTAGILYRDNFILAQAPNTHYTSFGSRALEDVTTGQDNVAIGGEALRQVTSAAQNTAVGGLAGVHTTSAGQNTYIGYVAGYFDTGSANCYVGAYSGRKSGSLYTYANTYIGQSAGYLSGDNDKCVAVGQRAGGGIEGTANTMLGWQAGYKGGAANPGGSYNIMVGAQAGLANTGNGNIIIGILQDVYDPSGNDQLNIGGLIWGTDLSRTSDVSAGKVGIRTKEPQYELDVKGRINCDQGFYQNGSLIQLPRVYSTYENIVRDTTHTFYIENYQGGAATGHYDHTLGATFINVSVRRG